MQSTSLLSKQLHRSHDAEIHLRCVTSNHGRGLASSRAWLPDALATDDHVKFSMVIEHAQVG